MQQPLFLCADSVLLVLILLVFLILVLVLVLVLLILVLLVLLILILILVTVLFHFLKLSPCPKFGEGVQGTLHRNGYFPCNEEHARKATALSAFFQRESKRRKNQSFLLCLQS